MNCIKKHKENKMKTKLISLLLIATLVFALAAGCAKTSGDGGSTKTSTPASVATSQDAGTSNQAQDLLHFMSDGQIRIDTKFGSGHSIDALKLKINGEAVTFGTAKTYSGEIKFTLEGVVDFEFYCKVMNTNGAGESLEGSTTYRGGDETNLLRTLNARAEKFDSGFTRMYVLLTDDKDAAWNANL